jgi:hypothetical protein
LQKLAVKGTRCLLVFPRQNKLATSAGFSKRSAATLTAILSAKKRQQVDKKALAVFMTFLGFV